MMRRIPDEDMKKFDEIQKWLIFDDNGQLVLRDDTPDEIRKMREKLLREYFPFD